MQCQRPAAGAVILAVLVIGVFAGVAQAQPASPGAGDSKPGASVFVPEKIFEFKPVIDGAKVIHDFVVMNKGSDALVISDVRTG
jgi:hypothetical protein